MSTVNSEFRAVCIIGWPAGHSRSPLIHNYWIKQHGLNAEYRRESQSRVAKQEKPLRLSDRQACSAEAASRPAKRAR